MLDQSFLSLKNAQPTVAANESTNSANSDVSLESNTSAQADKNSKTVVGGRFSEVFKETETAIKSVNNESAEPRSFLETASLTTVNLVDISSELTPLNTPALPRGILVSDLQNITIDITTEVNSDVVELEIDLSSDTELPETLAIPTDDLETIDVDILTDNAAIPLAIAPTIADTKVNDKTITILPNQRLPEQSPSLTTSSTILNTSEGPTKSLLTDPLMPATQTSLSLSVAAASNKAFAEQFDKIVAEQINLGNGDASIDIDSDLLKGLTPLNPASASSQAALAEASKTPLTVTIPFQQAQWGSAVAEKVMWLSSHGLQEAEIQLDPPELGPLQVKVSIENDQAHVSFVVQHSNVKEALEQTATRLREMFDAEGIDLVDVDVSDQSADQGQEDAEALANEWNEATDNAEPQANDQNAASNVSYIATSESGIDAYV